MNKKAQSASELIAWIIAIALIALAFIILWKTGYLAKFFKSGVDQNQLAGADLNQQYLESFKSGMEYCYRLHASDNPFPLNGVDCGKFNIQGKFLETAGDGKAYTLTYDKTKIKQSELNCLQATLGKTSTSFQIVLIPSSACSVTPS